MSRNADSDLCELVNCDDGKLRLRKLIVDLLGDDELILLPPTPSPERRGRLLPLGAETRSRSSKATAAAESKSLDERLRHIRYVEDEKEDQGEYEQTDASTWTTRDGHKHTVFF